MKLYRITLKLQSGLGTPLKGDTLFGHFCWQVVHDPGLVNLGAGLPELVKDYETRPGVVFSSALLQLKGNNDAVCYALKRPDLPLHLLSPAPPGNPAGYWRERKKQQAKKWLLIGEDLHIDLTRRDYLTDTDLLKRFSLQADEDVRRLLCRMGTRELFHYRSQPHNTINRLTGSTGLAPFAPYTQTLYHYCPGVRLAVVVGIDEQVTDIKRVMKALTCIGQWGYGKDASIGQGRFEVEKNYQKLSWLDKTDQANACYTLGPAVTVKNFYVKAFFTPFIRFGKHGDAEARGRHPFKSPVIMADEGAVLIPRDRGVFNLPYLGVAVTKDISLSEPNTIMQGYSLYLPCTMPPGALS